MRVGLIQVDGKMPNLALLKLAQWHKNRGDDITILDISDFKFDRIYGSKIFMGGSGYDVKAKLPPEIEEVEPDWESFGLDYEIKFSTRGCPRNCDFCIVKEKEGDIREVGLGAIKHSKVILMDNNFLALPSWKEKLQYFINNDIKVNFNQGLDIRLIDDEKAEMLSRVKYYDRKFKRRQIYFAFDDPKLEPIVREKLKILLKYIQPPQRIMVYILCGYNTTLEEDMHRYKVLWEEFGVLPYVQIYNNRKGRILHLFAKWVNKRIHKKYSWESWLKMNNAHATARGDVAIMTPQNGDRTVEKSANKSRRGEILESPDVTLRGLAQKVVEKDKGLKYVF